MATVTEAVKESLLGSTAPPNLSSESRATFLKYAQQDADGELYMNEEAFINAVAPPEEDYVRLCLPLNRSATDPPRVLRLFANALFPP